VVEIKHGKLSSPAIALSPRVRSKRSQTAEIVRLWDLLRNSRMLQDLQSIQRELHLSTSGTLGTLVDQLHLTMIALPCQGTGRPYAQPRPIVT